MQKKLVKCECEGHEVLCEQCGGTGKRPAKGPQKKIVVICEGGLVQNVFISDMKAEFEVEIIDHDITDGGEKEEIAEYNEKFKAFETERDSGKIIPVY